MSHRIVGVIPARFGSTRFPGKMLAELAGEPLVNHTVRRAQAAENLDDVIVATDDERIAQAVAVTGARTVMTREDHPSGSDRIAEAVADLDVDVVINIQGDEPLISPGLIDQLAARMLADPSIEMATADTPILTEEELVDPSVVQVVCDAQDRALYFSRSMIPFSREAKPADLIGKGVYWRHLGLYAFRKEFLLRFVANGPVPLEEIEKLEQLRALAMGARIGVIHTKETAPGVDTPEDLEKAAALLLAKENH